MSNSESDKKSKLLPEEIAKELFKKYIFVVIQGSILFLVVPFSISITPLIFTLVAASFFFWIKHRNVSLEKKGYRYLIFSIITLILSFSVSAFGPIVTFKNTI